MRLPLALLLLTPVPVAQEAWRVRVESARPAEEAAAFEAAGHDVLEGGVEAAAFQLVVDAAELARLRASGRSLRVLERGRPLAELAAADVGGLGGYPDLAAIEAEMDAVAAAHPQIARVVDLTATYGVSPTFEGRHLRALVVSDNVQQEEDEPATLIVSAHHCREIVTPLIALEAAHRLTDGYASDPAIQALVDENEVWIAPLWNPDGYHHVFTANNLWRKNRRVFADGIGVDLNRNYPFGWDNACAGSSSASNDTYKGPAPASEPESQTMLALAQDRNFAKLLDFHSFGEEVLWGYDCPSHPLDTWLQAQAITLSFACGYGGDERPPSADGEHYEWQLAGLGTFAFLVETEAVFQPPLADALAEAAQVWPGIRHHLERPIPVWGRVTDACTGEPLAAAVDISASLTYPNGEQHQSGGPFGRYHLFLPPGSGSARFHAPGYLEQTHSVDIVAGQSVQLDVALTPALHTHLSGSFQIGTTIGFGFDAPSDAGAPYLAALGLSGTSPGVPWGGCTFPLNLDALALLSLANQAPFSGFSGVLDGAGQASGALDVPSIASLVGQQAHVAFLTFDPLSFDARHASEEAGFVFVP